MSIPIKLAAICLLLLAGCSTARTTGGNPSLLMPADAIVERLDSLAAVSHDEYLHMHIGPCLGRCEAYFSIYRKTPAEFHIYEGEGWIYNEFQREDILYRLRRPLTSDVAENIYQRASEIGLFTFVDDQTEVLPDHPRIWLRARIGGQVIALNNVNLGGTKYAGAGKDTGLYKTYIDIRGLLFRELSGRGTGGDR